MPVRPFSRYESSRDTPLDSSLSDASASLPIPIPPRIPANNSTNSRRMIGILWFADFIVRLLSGAVLGRSPQRSPRYLMILCCQLVNSNRHRCCRWRLLSAYSVVIRILAQYPASQAQPVGWLTSSTFAVRPAKELKSTSTSVQPAGAVDLSIGCRSMVLPSARTISSQSPCG